MFSKILKKSNKLELMGELYELQDRYEIKLAGDTAHRTFCTPRIGLSYLFFLT